MLYYQRYGRFLEFINNNAFEGGWGAYLKGGAYSKEGAKSNHYGS